MSCIIMVLKWIISLKDYFLFVIHSFDLATVKPSSLESELTPCWWQCPVDSAPESWSVRRLWHSLFHRTFFEEFPEISPTWEKWSSTLILLLLIWLYKVVYKRIFREKWKLTLWLKIIIQRHTNVPVLYIFHTKYVLG